MKLRTKRFLIAGAVAATIAGQAFAMAGPSNPLAGHQQGPACHGSNQVPCRPDPQPDHGNDCGSNAKVPLNSNDHCGEETPV